MVFISHLIVSFHLAAGVLAGANFMACWCDSAASEDECLSVSFGERKNAQLPSLGEK